MKSDLVNLRGLARVLCLPVPWLKAEAERGDIPCLRVGQKLRFNPEAVARVLARRAAANPIRLENEATQ